MDGRKDLFVQPLSSFEDMMYEEMQKDKLKLKQLKKILEVSNEKNTTDDSNIDVNRV